MKTYSAMTTDQLIDCLLHAMKQNARHPDHEDHSDDPA
jgi:hypothetical protein